MWIDASYGAAFMGLLCGAILYGVTILQTWLYYRTYPKDPRIVKVMVFVLWFLDTVHLALCTTAMYWYLVTNFANPLALSKTTWSMNLQTDCNGLIGMFVEFFFARRVWIMSRNWLLSGVIVFLACIHFGLGVVFTIEEFRLLEVSQFRRLTWVTCTGLGAAAAADIVIACSLCFYLSRSRTGFKRTDSLITTLMVYSLNTGLLTSVIASICVVTFATMPTNFVWLAFFWVLGKCYVNSLLAALNSRDSLREMAAVQDNTFLQLSPFHASIASNQDNPPSATPFIAQFPKSSRVLAINVETTTMSKSDYLASPARSSTTNVSTMV